jgi:transcription elongation factor Elf1
MLNLDKLFQLRCQRCRYSEMSSGLSPDLKHLFEIKKCATCGGPRKFRCPRCGSIAVMKRVHGNSDGKPPVLPTD